MRDADTSQPDVQQWGKLFLLIAITFGAIARLAPTALSGFPVNDGGMFYAMIGDLRANHFLLPATTSYNNLAIPFAYPPLSLYAGALLSVIGVPTMEIMRWLPALVSTAAIPAFYWSARQMLASPSKAALAAVVYALMPRSFSWYVMGGGLSRSFGILFLLLTCGSAWLAFTKPSARRTLVTAVLGTGAVLSHPETALHTVAICALIWLFYGRSRRGVWDALIIAIGVLVLSSPWWGSVVAQHGLAPFQSALNAGGHNWLFWIPWLTMDFAEERFATVLTVLGLIGLAVQCIRRDWFLPAWLLLPFAVDPRSGVAIASLPLAMLAGCGLSDFLLPNIAALAAGEPASRAEWTTAMNRSRSVKVAMAYVVLVGLLSAFAYSLILAGYAVPATDQQALKWVEANTRSDGLFVVLTGRPDPFSDPIEEWFPVLAHRTSVSTIQGQEWTLAGRFLPFRGGLASLAACLNASPACLDEWAATYDTAFDYVYIDKPTQSDLSWPPSALAYQLRNSSNYQLLFENDGTAIFERK